MKHKLLIAAVLVGAFVIWRKTSCTCKKGQP